MLKSERYRGVRWPLWSNHAEIQRGIEGWADARLRKGWAPSTLATYGHHIARGWPDPIAYLRGLDSWQAQQHAKHALAGYGEDREIDPRHVAAIRAVPEPLRPAPRPVQIPDVDTWHGFGPAAIRRHPGAKGDAIWCLLYSGLRVGDLAGLSRPQVETAAAGLAVVRQKGRGGRRRRVWQPVPMVLTQLRRLAHEPGWTILYQLIGPTHNAGCAWFRRQIPKPYTPHTFRRCFATYLHAMGADLLTICVLGGWDSTASVERYIVHIPPERVRFWAARLHALLMPAGRH